MSSQTIDYILRSRKTILSILAKRGYDIKPYEKFGVEEVEAMIKAPAAMRMDLKRPADATDTGIVNCRVEYAVNKLKAGGSSQGLDSLINQLLGTETEEKVVKGKQQQAPRDDDRIDITTTEVMVILMADTFPLSESFHTKALQQYTKNKLRIAFFLIDNLVNNPAEHVLVPKHERVPSKEHERILGENYIQRKQQLPFIVFHVDMQARILGLVPGDIVKITRPSPSAGYYTEYRVCAP